MWNISTSIILWLAVNFQGSDSSISTYLILLMLNILTWETPLSKQITSDAPESVSCIELAV